MEEIRGIAEWLARHSGISTGIIGDHSLARAVRRRLQHLGLEEISEYERLLFSCAEEQQCLVELVVVPETWFFRDRHPYRYLREHISSQLATGLPSQPLRLLSAPCATGEEPYSMAMSLLELGLPSQAFRIDAIDICRRSIHRARQAVYGRHSFRGVSDAERQRHFLATPEGHVPQPATRESVRFRCSNLMNCLGELAGGYEVIFCRNLLIYLEQRSAQLLFASLAELLRPGGLLIVGSAETAMVPGDLFTPIRESFVFGFHRREISADPAVAAHQGSDQQRPAALPASAGPAMLPSTRSRPVRERRPALRPEGAVAYGRAARPAAAAPQPVIHSSGRPGEMERELQRCRLELAQDPASYQAHLHLAHCLVEHNEHEEALICLRRCLYLRPDCRQAMELMIVLTETTGDPERVRQLRARLERLDR